MRIAIIGLGYVGLPLCLQFAKRGAHVLGLDIDPKKVNAINRHRSYIQEIKSADIGRLVRSGHFAASGDFTKIRGVDAVIICVPTPLKRNRTPDISFILKTGRAIAPHLSHGMLVVLESTTYPGTTEDELRPVLEKGSGLIAGRDFFLGYSPERQDPGNRDAQVGAVPKIISGFTPACLRKVKGVYGRAIRKLIPVSSCRVAEATKLLENIFRTVNIALVNELKSVYSKMEIDIWEVIDAARTKPFGFMPFYPGPGWGGHCIPIDPFYLAWKARQYSIRTRFIEIAGEVNRAMPLLVVSRLAEALAARREAIKGSSILVLGLAYKENIDDDRESPSYRIMDILKSRGARVSYYDPHVRVIRPSREHAHWAGLKSGPWNKASVSKFDAVVISTAHKNVNYGQLAAWAKCIVDTRNVMAPFAKLHRAKIWKA